MEPNINFTKKAHRDYKLVLLVKEENNQKAFYKLMKYYENSIYFMLLKMTNNSEDARDLTVESFEKAFININSYTPVYAFSTWLFRIASNNCIDFIRKKRKTSQNIDLISDDDSQNGFLYNISSEELDPEESMIKEQKINNMREIVKNLKPRYRELIELHYFNELGYGEIADQLHLPVGTVKAQLFRAREYLFNTINLKHYAN